MVFYIGRRIRKLNMQIAGGNLLPRLSSTPYEPTIRRRGLESVLPCSCFLIISQLCCSDVSSFKRRLLETVRWTASGNLAFPQRDKSAPLPPLIENSNRRCSRFVSAFLFPSFAAENARKHAFLRFLIGPEKFFPFLQKNTCFISNLCYNINP